MLFCTNCGNKLTGAQKFCPACGKPVTAAPPPVPQAVLPPSNLGGGQVPVYGQQAYRQAPALQQQINITIPQASFAPPVTKWAVPRLIIGIATMVLFVLMQVQSCAMFADEAMNSSSSELESAAGMISYVASFFFLIAGIISTACRKSKGGAIAAGAVYLLCFVLTAAADFSYFGEMGFYSFLSVAFGAVLIIGGIAQRKPA
ncbi:MAG: zinc ribbon domain-containing protein [Treponema sp.]|jgi:tryptophan-rich sensory protein|nr:zinc ribbon domain-containing protein [Treponema sp.]